MQKWLKLIRLRILPCVEGRGVSTYQKIEVGAKVLLESSGIKSKYAVINIQARRCFSR
jgi:hypothetical protein